MLSAGRGAECQGEDKDRESSEEEGRDHIYFHHHLFLIACSCFVPSLIVAVQVDWNPMECKDTHCTYACVHLFCISKSIYNLAVVIIFCTGLQTDTQTDCDTCHRVPQGIGKESKKDKNPHRLPTRTQWYSLEADRRHYYQESNPVYLHTGGLCYLCANTNLF